VRALLAACSTYAMDKVCMPFSDALLHAAGQLSRPPPHSRTGLTSTDGSALYQLPRYWCVWARP
jgi:hypothetical protein